MNPIISQMNDILQDWKKEHDHFDAISFSFSEEDGFICFAGVPLYPADADMLIESAHFDAESIVFTVSGGRSIEVGFAWPEDKPPVLSFVMTVPVDAESDSDY